MGTTLASVHILNGDIEQAKKLLPDAIIGAWSSNCVSIFSPEFIPGLVEKKHEHFQKSCLSQFCRHGCLTATQLDSLYSTAENALHPISLVSTDPARWETFHFFAERGISQRRMYPVYAWSGKKAVQKTSSI